MAHTLLSNCEPTADR